MIDPIVMYHPSNPGATTWVEREAYRQTWFPKGWLSFDDPYNGGDPRMPPGTIIDSTEITADAAQATTTFAEITSLARVDVPQLGQPVIIQADIAVASVTSVGSWSLGFCRTSNITPLGGKGLRRIADIPLSTADGEGLPITLRHRVQALTTADTWTLVSQRDAGTGTLKLEHNALFNGLITVMAG